MVVNTPKSLSSAAGFHPDVSDALNAAQRDAVTEILILNEAWEAHAGPPRATSPERSPLPGRPETKGMFHHVVVEAARMYRRPDPEIHQNPHPATRVERPTPMPNDAWIELLQDKLQPDAVGVALLRAGAFLTGYELVKTAIIDKVRDFLDLGIDEDGPIMPTAFETRMRSGGDSEFKKSVNWLIQAEAITQSQADSLEEIRSHRHQIAHELYRFLIDPGVEVSVELLADLYGIMRSLDRFWGGINVACNPDFDGVAVDFSGITSGASALLDYLLQIAGIEPTSDATEQEP